MMDEKLLPSPTDEEVAQQAEALLIVDARPDSYSGGKGSVQGEEGE